jgi:Protein of unknown function (DUF1592)/Protein of unknown function (DUF1588)/Protein of unknown function (DUF1595)/Protein of unknown function (DUF1585)/Protein of unknown function (DUF1587)
VRLRLETLAVVLATLGAAAACETENGGTASLARNAQAEPAAGEFVDAGRLKVAYRRVTESQYRHAIADVFGPGIAINARFEPEQRLDGLQAVGNTQLSVTTTGLEQYIALARSISDQAFDGEKRDARVGCTPSAPAAADAACAENFIKQIGRQLFRRPLTRAEIDRRVVIWKGGAEQSGDFYKGLKLSLVSLLVAPEFLFRVERAEDDPAKPGELRLDGYTKAARLSYLLWDTAPDAELLQAAQSGEIHTPAGLQKQLDRLIASPRLDDGARAFFTDMLHFEAFDTLTKDGQTYPRFSQAVADAAREETLRFMVDHLVAQKIDYRDIFTVRDTFINRTLAAIYDVAYPSSEPWARYSFPETSERSGILTQVTFLSLFSHPGRSSPTIRGVKLHEIFMCVKTPDPPADVDFSKVQATEKGTVRSRLIDHMTNPGCSTCHRISDPAGLTLEHFDAIGQRRTLENGQLIDVGAEIGGKNYLGAAGLGKYLHDSPLVPACLVRNVYYYGQGRPVDYKEQAYLDQQTAMFAQNGYRLPDLYRSIVSSPEFFKVVRPKEAPPAASVAGASTQGSSGQGSSGEGQ